MKSFKAITLKYVQVTDDVFHYFLSNCSSLETLRVKGSRLLVAVRAAGTSLRLKHLEISECRRLKSIHVFAPLLLSFKYNGRRSTINIESAPLLTKLSVGDTQDYIFKQLDRFSRFFSGLHSLTLNYGDVDNYESYKNIPELRNLKHLTIQAMHMNDFSLLPYTSYWRDAPHSAHLN